MSRWFWWVFGAGAGALALMNMIRFGAAGHDDTFIMLWSGQTFSLPHWFVNFNGESQEIASSWLAAWSATIATRLAPSSPLALYKLFGWAAGFATVGVLAGARARLFPTRTASANAWSLLCGALTLLAPTFAYWVHGGLETPYQALLFVLWVVATEGYIRRGTRADTVRLFVVVGLFVMVRTEGFWIIGATALVGALFRKRRIASIVGTTVSFALMTIVVRTVMTGAPWPNPVYAKLEPTFANIARGLGYVWGYAISGPLSALYVGTIAIAGLVLAQATRRTMSPALVAAAAGCVGQILFVVASGGNWMEYYRFFAPVVPLAGIVLAHGIDAALARVPSDRLGVARAGVFALLSAGALEQYAFDRGTNGRWHDGCVGPLRASALGGLRALDRELRVRNVEHARDERDLRPFIEGPMASLGDLRVATYQMGYFPYLVRQRFPVQRVLMIDTHGLNDRAIARVHAPKNHYGVDDGGGLERVALGLAGELSRAVLEQSPNAFYGFDASPEMLKGMSEAGYDLVWDRPGAKVFVKPMLR